MAGAVTHMSLEEFIRHNDERLRTLGAISFREPLRQCQLLIRADALENFSGLHDPDGKAWKPLAHNRIRNKGDGKPLRDTGLLMASVTATARARGSINELTDTYLVVGTNVEYARLHQEGGTVTPKNAKMLAIPLTREAARLEGARDFPRPLFVLSTNGKAFLAEPNPKGQTKRGKDRPPILHYVLKDKVVIPARPFLGIGAKLLAKMHGAFENWFRKFLGE